MSSSSFDEIEEIRFAGAEITGIFTGSQLTGETINLTETVVGTSTLVINVQSGTTASFLNLTANTFTSGTDIISINGTNGSENITGPNLVTTINGGFGPDTISAGIVDDTHGGPHTDTLKGGRGMMYTCLTPMMSSPASPH